MRKKKGLALYELITSQQSTNTPPLREVSSSKEHDVGLDHNILTPGRSIRMSIGTIGVIVAVCIALIVISYTMGFRKGSSVAREDYGNRLFEEFPVETFAQPEVLLTPLQTPTKMPSSRVVLPQETDPASWGPVLNDPRIQDTYYYTLMQTTKEGAMQLASFCRQKGLETYAISGNNTRLYRVVAFPGSIDRNSPSLRTVQSQIHAIGQGWSNTLFGRGSDLKDAYLSIYKK